MIEVVGQQAKKSDQRINSCSYGKGKQRAHDAVRRGSAQMQQTFNVKSSMNIGQSNQPYDLKTPGQQSSKNIQ